MNLSAHETHEQSQTMIGIDPHGRFLDPTELGVLKERRDRMVIEQQRSAMMAGQMRTTAGVAGAGPSPQGLVILVDAGFSTTAAV